MQNLTEEVDDLDELDNLQPTITPGTKTATTATAPATNPNIVAWDLNDTDETSSTVLKSSGLPFIKVSDGNPVRLAFVPGARIVGAPVHYDARAKRYFLCDSKPGVRSKCCQRLGDPKGRAAGLVFRYVNADPKTGKLAPNVVPVVEVAAFVMSRSNWDDIKGALEEGSTVEAVDFRISVSEKQLTRKVGVISRVCRWLEIKDEAMLLAAPYLADSTQLQRALGRPYEAGTYEDAKLGDVEAL